MLWHREIERKTKEKKGRPRRRQLGRKLKEVGCVLYGGDGEEIYSRKKITCDHSCGVLPEVDHPVISFLDDFFNNWSGSRVTEDTTVEDLAKPIFQKHPQVWNDKSSRDIAVGIFVRIGTNMLLSEHIVLGQALTLVKVIVVLENYDGNSFDAVYNSRVSATKKRDLGSYETDSSKRDCLKFYSKRTPCSCLKGMHKEARKNSMKMGLCYGCAEEKERMTLSVCSRCMVAQYCSRECQVATWDEHRDECDVLVSAHQHQMSRINKVSAEGT